MKAASLAWFGIVMAACLICVGCGDGLSQVSGTVLLDGQPLPEGEIIFEESDKTKTPAAGKVIAGKYTVRVVPGQKLVRISASRPTKIPDPVMGAAAREALIARQFNVETKLTHDVAGARQEAVDFKVEALP